METKTHLGLLGDIHETMRKYEEWREREQCALERTALTEEEFYDVLDACVAKGKFLVMPDSDAVN